MADGDVAPAPCGRHAADGTLGGWSCRASSAGMTGTSGGPGADRATFSANAAKRGADGSAFGWWKVSDVLGLYGHLRLGYAFGNSTMDARGGGALVWFFSGSSGS